MIKVYILLLIQLPILSFSQKSKYVCWTENNKLDISCFCPISQDSVEEKYANFGAVSVPHMKYIHPNQVVAVLDIEESWIVKELLEDSLQIIRILNHEQKHFDITEIYTRKARNNIQKIIDNNLGSDFLSKILYKIDSELLSYQLLYDLETNNGLDIKKQEYWNKKIENELKQLEKYRNKSIIDCKSLH